MPIISLVIDSHASTLADTLASKFDFLAKVFSNVDKFGAYKPNFNADSRMAQYLSEAIQWLTRYVVARAQEQPRITFTDGSTDLVLDLSGGALEDLQVYQENKEALRRGHCPSCWRFVLGSGY